MKSRILRSRGMSLLGTLALLTGSVAVTVGVVSLAGTSSSIADKTNQKVVANGLAESGAQALYDQIRNAILAGNSPPSTLGSTTLSTSMMGTSITLGTYSARVLSVTTNTSGASTANSSTSNSTSTGSGTTTVDVATAITNQTRNWTFWIEGTGVSSGGSTSIVRTRFSGSLDERITNTTTTTTTTPIVTIPGTTTTTTTPTGSPVPLNVGTEVLQSNERVDMIVNQGIRTYDNFGSPRRASIFANSGATWQMASGSKSSWSNPNVFDIQGQIMVPGNGSNASALAMTQGASGMGNTNGTTNYQTQALTNPSVGANTIMNAGNRRSYPDEATVNQWKANWDSLVPAVSASRRVGSLTTSQVPQRPGDQWRILTAPMVIEGDLTIEQGQQLRLMPSSTTDPSRNVIYVKGNIRNRALFYNLGVTLVFDGDYQDASSAEYRLDSQGSPLSMNQIIAQAAMVSTKKASDAIQISTNSTTQYGLVYSALGGVQITGNLEMRDTVVIAAGSGSNGNLRIAPNQGNSYVAWYNPNVAGVRSWWGAGTAGTTTTTTTTPPTTTTGTPTTSTNTTSTTAIVRPFTPGRLTSWQKVR